MIVYERIREEVREIGCVLLANLEEVRERDEMRTWFEREIGESNP